MSKACLVGCSAKWKGIAVGLTSGDGVVVDRAAAVPVRNAVQIHRVGFIASPVVGGFRGFDAKECGGCGWDLNALRCGGRGRVNKLLQRVR